jgi:hypothetical protein
MTRRGRTVAIAGLWSLVLGCGSGDDAGTQLVATVAEPPGANCAAGGFVVQVGTDNDGNGELDAGEITSTEYVCGSVTTGAIVRVDEEAPGANCAGGGVAVHSGIDDDADGVLDDDEIDDTGYVCEDSATGIDGVVFGDVGIGEAADADRLVGVRRVTGSITVEGAEVTSIDLGTLEEVGGSIIVRQSGLTSLAAPVLEQAGSLWVYDVGAEGGVQEISMPSLRVLWGLFLVEDELANIDLPALERVGSAHFGGDIDIFSEALIDLSFPSLWYVSDDWQVSIPSVESVSAPALETIGALTFVEASSLVALDFSALERARFVQVDRCTVLDEISGFPTLREVEGLGIARNPQLTEIAFPALMTAVELGVINNPFLPTCQATALAIQSNATDVTISGNDDDGTCN